MEPKQILFDRQALEKVKEGIDGVANAVKVTLGYGGRTVIISEPGLPSKTTKDGTSVANKISFRDEVKDAGAKIAKEISAKTGTDVGDGTTTVCVLLQAMIEEGMKYVSESNPVELKAGMMKAADFVVSELDKMKKPAEGDTELLRQVATVSANNDPEIGKIVGDIFEQLGSYGVVAIEDSPNEETHIDKMNGFQFGSGWASHYFISNIDKNTSELQNPYVLIVEGKVDKVSDIMKITNLVAVQKRAIIVIAEDFDANVIGTFLQNNQHGVLKSCCVKYNLSGNTKDDLMNDLCAITGATLVTEKLGHKLHSIDVSYLGECEKSIVSRTEATILKGKSNEKLLQSRIEDAKLKVAEAKHPAIKELMLRRLAKLQGGIAICYVGGMTELERDEKRDRIEDSIKATKAALEEGVLPGGGASLMKCAEKMKNLMGRTQHEDAGIHIVRNALDAPATMIVVNTIGGQGKNISHEIKNSATEIGFNAKTAVVEDLFSAGIIDPAKVVRLCVQNAVSGAIQFLNSSVVIVHDKSTNQ